MSSNVIFLLTTLLVDVLEATFVTFLSCYLNLELKNIFLQILSDWWIYFPFPPFLVTWG